MLQFGSPDPLRWKPLWLAGLLCCFGPGAFAETILFQLSGGDRIFGEVVWENSDSVIISNVWAGELTIPREQIVSRQPATPTATAIAGGASPAVRAVPVPQAPAKPAAASSPWKGEAQLGVDLLYGAKERQIGYGRFKLAYTRAYESDPTHFFRNAFDFTAEYGKTDGVKSSERLFATDKTSFDLQRRWYLYSLVGGGHDYRLRIDLQYEAGPGVGYHLFTTTNFTMNVEGGLNYQYQYRRNKDADGTEPERSEVQDVYYRLAEDLTWKIGRFTLSEKFEIFPRVNFGDLRARFEANVSYELWKNLFVNLTVLDLYDTQPADDVNENELQVRSSLGLKF
jgi:putative salt-induced outer membrane protein YdiY